MGQQQTRLLSLPSAQTRKRGTEQNIQMIILKVFLIYSIVWLIVLSIMLRNAPPDPYEKEEDDLWKQKNQEPS